ncbi:BREX-1 system adenine-specific DNA-methyltransferase PglX [Alkalihalobacterium bogoriense]|uniref:BREX-1 system adenine-specific DNA-methyltransferase PglX n=1 Tax=Alkalihalobacterium bogoriense TaxID=246272 RepID=UPI00047B74AD|nr:BREX-1 system adenine-specific DNA-methyltransferase PglX [Alkalihalobacterium bogoriense]
MNKTALKNFATSARRELLKKVEAKALKIGISADKITKAEIESSDAIFIDGRQLSKSEKVQRERLIDRINQTSFSRVMEEVAYTWFNRFTALRFMEVNNYLPTKVRVFSSSNADSAEPDMMKEALSLDLDLDKELVYEMKVNNESEELFKYLIIKHCNDLNRYMPFMFEKIDDFTEILFPEGLLAKDSFLREMTNTEKIAEEDWNKIEIIGWLYQFYIAEEKERVFKQKSKYKAEEIPFATQLFTPDWIVRYMVQNSLGRYWIESHPEHRDLLSNWEFYLENPNQDLDFEEKLAPYINGDLKVEDIKCFDPAMGSGHILVYMFDVLFEIYSKCGYMDREIPRLIIENNLYGLDIDDRAYQLACFSVVMKALEYNKRFFRSIEREGLQLNLASIQETNSLDEDDIAYIAGEREGEQFNTIKEFIEQFKDAKTIGSLLKVEKFDLGFLKDRLDYIQNNPAENLLDEEIKKKALNIIPNLLKQTEIMANQYEILVTNPPYMGYGSMNRELSDFLRGNYPDSKSDLFACFMEIDHYIKIEGFYATVNQHSWMFLNSFEKLREKIINKKIIKSMLHLGPRAFEEIGGEVVQSTAFVLRNTNIPGKKGIYLRLVDERSSEKKKNKAKEAVYNSSVPYRYTYDQVDFKSIPQYILAYWLNKKVTNLFNSRTLYDISISDGQTKTGNNDKYLRFLWEVDHTKIGEGKKWVIHAKGGSFRKWYGNIETVINWSEDARAHYKNDSVARIAPEYIWFRKGITWTLITSGKFSVRILEEDSTFNLAAPSIFIKNVDDTLYFIGLLNSKVHETIIRALNPTLNTNISDIRRIPFIEESKGDMDKVKAVVAENINISKQDWNSYETSLGFKKHPLLVIETEKSTLENVFNKWKAFLESQFIKLKNNEESLNTHFIELYGMHNDLNPRVEDEDIKIRKPDIEGDIKSCISYAIGCMFGRYSLDEEGLIYAGGEFDPTKYQTFPADQDNILPILPGAYFEDDIVSRFNDFVKVTFGEETLSENLDFIADTLGKKKGETAKETIRRYFLNDFYKDHVQTYKKRPIYWLFTSGKQKAFNCLIYMHRYDKTTLSRIRTDYLHEYQIRLDAEKRDLLTIIEGDSTAKEISDAKKELKTLEKKIEELKSYDEVLHHMADMQIEIDLDDGVVVNYEKFKGLVAKI